MADSKPMPPLSDSDVARFWSKVDRDESGCWEWTAGTFTQGYGQFSVGSRTDGSNRNVKAHRVSYTLLVGPIPGGLTLDHLCRNKRCVRTDHLEPVPLALNVSRATSRDICKNGHARIADNLDTSGRCRTCETEKRRRAGEVDIRTHCVNGHLRAEAGWYETRNSRTCAICWNEDRQRMYSARRDRTGMHDSTVHCRKGHVRAEVGWHARPSGRRECAACYGARHPDIRGAVCRNGHDRSLHGWKEFPNGTRKCAECHRMAGLRRRM